VDRPCFLIVATDCSDREIDIERLHVRTQAMKLLPDKDTALDLREPVLGVARLISTENKRRQHMAMKVIDFLSKKMWVRQIRLRFNQVPGCDIELYHQQTPIPSSLP